jgi:hypothetical protein
MTPQPIPRPPEPDRSETPLRVFLSYAHESEPHRAAVLALALSLRADGFDAVIDRMVPPPPDGWSRWMQGELARADRVIVVCSPAYYRRATGVERVGVGLGASWEWHLLRREVYVTRGAAPRLTPVHFGATDARYIPEELWDRPRYDLPTGYAALVRDLRGEAEVPPAPLPPLPVRSDGTQWVSRWWRRARVGARLMFAVLVAITLLRLANPPPPNEVASCGALASIHDDATLMQLVRGSAVAEIRAIAEDAEGDPERVRALLRGEAAICGSGRWFW